MAVGAAIRAPAPLTLHGLTRPFLLLLEDTATHTPLFLALITDPSQP